MLNDLKAKPHLLRDTFRTAGLTAGDVAKAIGLSLGRTQQLLAGKDRTTARTEEALQELARLCEADKSD